MRRLLALVFSSPGYGTVVPDGTERPADALRQGRTTREKHITMNMMNRLVVGIATAAVLTTGAVTATAQPTAGTPSAPHATAASAVALVFVKNKKDPSNSTLQVWNGRTRVTSYRAGSGLGTAADNGTKAGKRYRDECASNAGWLPNGTYRPSSFETSRNGTIKGYAIGLPAKKCHPRKTERNALFIHSEMTKDRKQGPRKGADSPQRWDGVSDYKSYGCIKLHPNHIAQLFSYMNKHGRAALLTVR
ncbi:MULTISPECIES: L,D-transpeptidase family protein [unclassified Streptomyces]|uniref:L,D-transpeptidase family protein n=1 Tax=unclassified Streptomyces TaxID=2593676 RepID=UPI001E3685DB|nr:MULTISPECIES: L,D-transpeptidase family protein [unclassified Streptomyces]MDU0303602.1 L,D-transpeptidase family protein [Streptomyces sp. PAL114]